MKKFVLFLITVSISVFIFAGCSSSDNQTDATHSNSESLVEEANIHKTADIIGSWQLKTVTDSNSMCQTVKEYCEEKNINQKDFCDTFTFNDDNTVIHEIDGKKINGTYEFDDPTYSMTCLIDNVKYDMTYDNRYDMFYLTDTKLQITKEYGRK